MKLRGWYAVFCRLDVIPSPSEMLNALRPGVSGLTYDFRLENDIWRQGTFGLFDKSAPSILVSRTLPGDKDWLLNGENWHVELRSCDGPHCQSVIEHLHGIRQIINLTPLAFELGNSHLARICEQFCGHIARTTDGLIQVYQGGFFNAEGESLHPYCPKHRLTTK